MAGSLEVSKQTIPISSIKHRSQSVTLAVFLVQPSSIAFAHGDCLLRRSATIVVLLRGQYGLYYQHLSSSNLSQVMYGTVTYSDSHKHPHDLPQLPPDFQYECFDHSPCHTRFPYYQTSSSPQPDHYILCNMVNPHQLSLSSSIAHALDDSLSPKYSTMDLLAMSTRSKSVPRTPMPSEDEQEYVGYETGLARYDAQTCGSSVYTGVMYGNDGESSCDYVAHTT